MKDEKLFLKKLAQNDKAAVKDIFQANVPLLLKYGHRFTNDAGLVDECLVVVFIDLWKNRATVAQNKSLKVYLLEMLRQKIELKLGQSRLKRA
ncbi:MAG TPA: RNA polymerase [Microscillaceae bacterium]|nr:RNA polymerase [Microscillaceae bacterium]